MDFSGHKERIQRLHYSGEGVEFLGELVGVGRE